MRPHTTRLRCNNRGGERRGATGGGGEGGDKWVREGGGGVTHPLGATGTGVRALVASHRDHSAHTHTVHSEAQADRCRAPELPRGARDWERAREVSLTNGASAQAATGTPVAGAQTPHKQGLTFRLTFFTILGLFFEYE